MAEMSKKKLKYRSELIKQLLVFHARLSSVRSFSSAIGWAFGEQHCSVLPLRWRSECTQTSIMYYSCIARENPQSTFNQSRHCETHQFSITSWKPYLRRSRYIAELLDLHCCLTTIIRPRHGSWLDNIRRWHSIMMHSMTESYPFLQTVSSVTFQPTTK